MLQRAVWLAALAGVIACAEPPAPAAPAPKAEPSARPPASTPEPEPARPNEPEPAPTPSETKTRAEPIDVGAPVGSPPGPNAGEGPARFQGQLRAALRRCYERALKSNPNMKGTLAVSLRVDAHGRVNEVKLTPEGGLDAGLVQCIEARIRAVVLEPAPGGSQTLEFPINIDAAR